MILLQVTTNYLNALKKGSEPTRNVCKIRINKKREKKLRTTAEGMNDLCRYILYKDKYNATNNGCSKKKRSRVKTHVPNR